MDKDNLCYLNSTDVRKKWSTTIDTVVREHPVFFQRTRDNLIMLDVATMRMLFENLHYHLALYQEDDGSVTCVEEDLNLVENGDSENSAITQMMTSMRDYANDYYQQFNLWSKAPNRKAHVPYVLKIMASNDAEMMEDIRCHAGEI